MNLLTVAEVCLGAALQMAATHFDILRYACGGKGGQGTRHVMSCEDDQNS